MSDIVKLARFATFFNLAFYFWNVFWLYNTFGTGVFFPIFFATFAVFHLVLYCVSLRAWVRARRGDYR